MAKTKYEKELEERSQATLVYMCEGKGLLHTGNREALIARLVAWEESQSEEPAPKPEPPATEPVVEPPASEPVVEPPASEPVVEPPASEPVD
ncbi:hypothetical protein ES706_04882 [subsurface metagenome]